jgi:translocation and assembly module TamA
MARFLYPLLLSILLIISPCGHAATPLRVSIEGISDELLENVRQSLSIVQKNSDEKNSPLSESLIAHLHKQATKEIEGALQPFGYYQPSIDSSLTENNDGWMANYHIQVGPPVIISQILITIDGTEKSEFDHILKNPAIAVGDRLQHQIYSNYKQRLFDTVFDAGYIDAQYTKSQLLVDIKQQSAIIDLALDTGPQYFFGNIRIEQSSINPALIQSLISINNNTPFNTDKLLALQLALSDTGYFNQIDIDIQRDNAIDRHIPVVITASSAKKLKYSTSLGYGTDTGPRIGFSLLNRRLNPLGHQLQFSTRLSSIEKNISTQYKIPIGNISAEYLDLFASGTSEQVNDIDTVQYTVGSSINQNRWGGRRRLSLTLLREDFSFDDEPAQTANLLIPGITYSYQQSDNTLFTRKGYSLSVDIHGGLESAVSEATFLYAKISGHSVIPLGRKTRFLSRLEFGALSTNEFENIPPSQRFFTGGAQSVRGYGYKDIAPRNELDNAVGGQYLATGSIELDHLFWGNYGAALFYDAGDAAADTQFTLKTAAGIGFRYRSPVGMIRIDLAHPFDDPNENIRLHISIGPDL